MSKDHRTEGYHASAESALCRLEDLTAEQKGVTASLRASILIETIWPYAFDHGAVRFSGIQAMLTASRREMGFTEAWFVNSHVQHWLAINELLKFKPDAVIHPDFQTRIDRKIK